MHIKNYGHISTLWRGIDQKILASIIGLFIVSIILVTSISPIMSNKMGLKEYHFIIYHILYLFFSFTFIILFSSLDKDLVKIISFVGFLLTLILLILVKFYGYEVKGAKRWISILNFSLQPSEFIKPFFSVVVAWFLTLKLKNHIYNILIATLLYLLVSSLLIIQPDIGMFAIITSIFCIQLFVAGLPIFGIIVAFITAIFSIFIAYINFHHVANRINNFLDAENTANYQVIKSIKAFEQGGLYGRGPGEGVIKQLIPDVHSDFIFSVAGEELGGILCLIIIAIYSYIIFKTIIKVFFIEDRFIQFASLGIISQFALQVIINIGVALNLLPTKGMTLPFISYGGSSIVSMGISIGIVLCFTKKSIVNFKYKIKEIDI